VIPFENNFENVQTLIYQMRRDSPFSEVSLKYSEWQHVPLHLVRVLKNGRVLDGAQTLMSVHNFARKFLLKGLLRFYGFPFSFFSCRRR
jgi:hypothetical protein